MLHLQYDYVALASKPACRTMSKAFRALYYC